MFLRPLKCHLKNFVRILTLYITIALHKDRTITITAHYFPLPYAIFFSFPQSFARTLQMQLFHWPVKENKISHWLGAQRKCLFQTIIVDCRTQSTSPSRHSGKTNHRTLIFGNQLLVPLIAIYDSPVIAE